MAKGGRSETEGRIGCARQACGKGKKQGREWKRQGEEGKKKKELGKVGMGKEKCMGMKGE